MIEIIVIWRLAVYIGKTAAQKGLKKPPYQVMAILLWISGELSGGILGNFISGNNSSSWLIYGMALAGAITGAGIAFLIMKFLPTQHVVLGSAESEHNQEIPSFQKFGRSIWVPLIIILLAFSCLCVVFGGSAIFQMRSLQQIQASNPIIGIKIDSNGQITESVKVISANENAIYFGFSYENPRGGEMPVTLDWYIDGNIAYSFSKTLDQGQVIVALDRKEIGLPEFNKGSYEVKARLGELFLTSASFLVK